MHLFSKAYKTVLYPKEKVSESLNLVTLLCNRGQCEALRNEVGSVQATYLGVPAGDNVHASPQPPLRYHWLRSRCSSAAAAFRSGGLSGASAYCLEFNLISYFIIKSTCHSAKMVFVFRN